MLFFKWFDERMNRLGCKTNKLANNLESEGRRGYIGKNTVDG